MPASSNGGVSGTIGAFNSIRRIGFSRTPELLATFVSVSFAVTIVSLAPSVHPLTELTEIAVVGLVLPAILVEFVDALIILRRDPILDFRRLMGIELASLVWLSFFLLVTSLIGIAVSTPSLWISGFLVGIAASLPVRLLAILTMSSKSLPREIFAAFVPPLIITRAFFGTAVRFLPTVNLAMLSTSGTVVILSGIILSLAGCLWIIRGVERAGNTELEESPLELFRAFLEHWLGSHPDALEEKLKVIGSERSIETGILSVSAISLRHKGSILVSDFHPGPYRDLGSSGLPSILKQFLAKSIGTLAHVPHGVSNHELNIVSRDNIDKLLVATRENFPETHSTDTVTVMIQRTSGEATVTGQAFGKVAVLMITLAPGEMEDLPQVVSDRIRDAAARIGLSALIIDAHNSISGPTSISPVQAEHIVKAAIDVLEALNEIVQTPFVAGAAEDPLSEFDPRDGIGPGGLSVLTIKNDKQTAAYLTIDGNNMEKGFRQEILDRLRGLGVLDGEVMTTDTHLVTGLVRSPLGYYPVGAHVSKKLLIDRIEQTVQRALSNMEPSSSGYGSFKVTVGVLGGETFNSITGFIGRVGRRIARSFYLLEVSSILLSVLLLHLV